VDALTCNENSFANSQTGESGSAKLTLCFPLELRKLKEAEHTHM